MEHQKILTIAEAEHPDPGVGRFGFGLDGPYVELCWAPVLGPTATLLLRRLPVLWETQHPATISQTELAGSLGLGTGNGSGSRTRLIRAMDRCVRFGTATWATKGSSLAVYGRLPALDRHQLERVPEWTRQTHHRLIATTRNDPEPAGPAVEAMTVRLDRLQYPHSASPARPTVPSQNTFR